MTVTPPRVLAIRAQSTGGYRRARAREITGYGAGSVQVARRLLAAYDVIEVAVPAARRPAVAACREALLAQSADRGLPPAGLRADRLSLG